MNHMKHSQVSGKLADLDETSTSPQLPLRVDITPGQQPHDSFGVSVADQDDIFQQCVLYPPA